MHTSVEPMRIERSSSGDLPPTLRSFQFWTLVLFASSLFFHLFEYLQHRGSHQSYPLARGQDRFYDFTIFAEKFQLFHTAQFFSFGFPINYPAPCCLVYEFFFRFCKPHELFAFVTFSVLAFVVPAALFARALVRRGVSPLRSILFCTVITGLSWPVVLLVDGANMEILVWLTLLIGMWAYATGRDWLAAAFFGIGASVKLFPFVLFGLYLSKKQWGRLLFGAFVFFAVSILSLIILGPTLPIAFHGLAFGMTSFKTAYMAQWRPGENGVDHSIFAFYKGLMVHIFHHSVFFPRALSVYLAVTAIGGLALYAFRIRFLPLLNQLLILTIASIYFTAFSGDGTLIHLYYPAAMLLLLACVPTATTSSSPASGSYSAAWSSFFPSKAFSSTTTIVLSAK
ncbi:MAG: glycosyltransferase family 87 protein [Janthinobacterium lividum]